ncbi:MAG: hypothetical protein EHM58_19460 [Ignavibacteriae bacterium]|nr:MAG: hypothetical protein EHM58_19460 [Ignavibacteriota bacterium]
MKVPTYHKYGITKSQLEKFDEKNRKISHLLTHKIPIAAGIVLGTTIYIINFRKYAPVNVLQVISQLFIFISLGILCVGLPMILFKLIENYYYRHIGRNNKTYINILKYKKDKEDYEYWHLRSDERFWKLIDGYTFEREVVSIYKKLGYDLKTEVAVNGHTPEFIFDKDSKSICMKFVTNKTIELPEEVESIVSESKSVYDKITIITSKGYKSGLPGKLNANVELLDTKDIVTMLKTINE